MDSVLELEFYSNHTRHSCFQSSCPTSPINGKMNGRNPFSVEEDEIMHLSRESEIKEKPVVKFDAEVQVTNLFFL